MLNIHDLRFPQDLVSIFPENIVGMLVEHGALSSIMNRKNQLASDVAHNYRIYEMLSEALALEKTATISRSMSSSVKVSRGCVAEERSSPLNTFSKLLSDPINSSRRRRAVS